MMNEHTPETEATSPNVQACNFRYAGRLSNDNTRALTSLCEKFAATSSNSLEGYLGATLQLKLVSLDQSLIQDYLATLPGDSYLMPCALGVMDGSFLMQLDIGLAVPVIDLLLGGAGAEATGPRELTDIDEEILRGVSALLVKELDRSWSLANLNYTLGRCIKAATLAPLFMANEKVIILLFEMNLAATTGALRIVLPASFVGYLLRHLKSTQTKKAAPSIHQSSPSLRQRILDCQFLVSADITQMRVMVKDLLTLEPGRILIMKSPVKRHGRLTIEGVDVFDASPVRSGAKKAAQVLPHSVESATAKIL